MVRAAHQVRAQRMSLPTAGPSAPILPAAPIRTRTGPTSGLCARSAMVSEIYRQGSRHALLAAATAAVDAPSRDQVAYTAQELARSLTVPARGNRAHSGRSGGVPAGSALAWRGAGGDVRWAGLRRLAVCPGGCSGCWRWAGLRAGRACRCGGVTLCVVGGRGVRSPGVLWRRVAGGRAGGGGRAAGVARGPVQGRGLLCWRPWPVLARRGALAGSRWLCERRAWPRTGPREPPG